MNAAPRWRHLLRTTVGTPVDSRLLCRLGALAVGLSLLGTATARAAPAASLKRLSLSELMELEVTSVSRRPARLSEVASAIQVVTGEEIRRSGATSLPRAMRLADNLHVAQKNAHDWAISARGFNTALANKLLVLVDGRAVYTPLFSGVFWNLQDPLLEDIDRIEVISGPGGSVWGANAVNGIINVITKPANETQGTFVTAGIGAQAPGLASARYGGRLGTGPHYRVYGKYSSWDAERLAAGGSAGDDGHRVAGGFRIDSEDGRRDRFTLQGDLYRGVDGITTGGDSRTRGGNLLGRWTRALGAESELEVQIYHDWSRLAVINSIPLAPAGELRDALETSDLDAQHRAPLGARHLVTWGLGLRHWRDSVENAPGLAFLPPDRSHDLWSGFVQDEIRLGAASTLTLGTKLEHNDYTGFELEPSLRFQVALTEDASLWAALSRAVRTPSRIDREISQPAPPYLVVLAGGGSFDSEEVIAAELGYRATLSATATLAIATFYNEYDDLRSTRTTPGTILPFFFANELEGETYGLELVARVQPAPRWRLHAGYTLLQEDIRVRAGGEDFNAARNEVADPQQQWSLRSALDLPGDLAVDAALRWVDALHINNGPTVGRLPSYLELDLRVEWQATPSLSLSLVGHNLLHDAHPEYGFPGASRVEIQRAVTGTLAWRR